MNKQDAPIHLAASFRHIMASGRSAAEACVILDRVLRSPDVEMTPRLPDGWRLTTDGVDLFIEDADGKLTSAEQYFFRLRREVFRKALVATTDGVSPPKPPVHGTPEQREAQATAALAEEPDLKDAPRDHFKAEYMKRFDISGRTFRYRVLPDARESVGLPRQVPSGRKA